MCRLLKGRVPMVQATGGEKPLSLATGDQVLLVQAMGGRAPLCGLRHQAAKCNLPLVLSTGGRDISWWLSWKPDRGMACHHWGLVSGFHLWPQSPQGSAKKKKKKKSTATEHHPLLPSLHWEHNPAADTTTKLSGSAQMLDHCPFPRSCN